MAIEWVNIYLGRMQTTVPGGKFAGIDGCEGCDGCEETDGPKGLDDETAANGLGEDCEDCGKMPSFREN